MATVLVSRPLTAERWFYLGMTGAVLLIVFAGFAPSFYLRGYLAPRAPMEPMTGLVMLHGLLFTSWVLLFAAQVGLISADRRALHRRLGITGFGLVVAMAIIGTLAALHGVSRHTGPPQFAPLAWLAIPLLDVPVFTTLIAAGLYNRRIAQTHKRLMLIATIGMALGALVAWDIRSQGHVHRATIAGGSFLIASWVFRLAIMQTAAWLSFAAWAQSFVT